MQVREKKWEKEKEQEQVQVQEKKREKEKTVTVIRRCLRRRQHNGLSEAPQMDSLFTFASLLTRRL